MPLTIQPTSGSLENPHPEQVVATPRPNRTLAAPAQPNVNVEEPGAVPVPVGPKFTNPGKATPQEAAYDLSFSDPLLRPYRGAAELYHGVKDLPPDPRKPGTYQEQAERGTTEILRGATDVATPVMIAGAVAQPELALLAGAGAEAGSYGAGKLADAVKASPDTKALLQEVGGIAGGFAGGFAHGGLRSAASPEDALTDLLWKRGYIRDAQRNPVSFASEAEARYAAREILRQNPPGIIDSLRQKGAYKRAGAELPQVSPAEAARRASATAEFNARARAATSHADDVVADISKLTRPQLAEYMAKSASPDKPLGDPDVAKAMYVADREAAQTPAPAPPEAPVEAPRPSPAPAVAQPPGVSPQAFTYENAKAAVEDFLDQHGRVSPTVLQRNLKLGYENAKAVLNRMVGEGVLQTDSKGIVFTRPTETQAAAIPEFRADEVEEAAPAVESRGETAPAVSNAPAAALAAARPTGPSGGTESVARPSPAPTPQSVAPASAPEGEKESSFQKGDSVTLPDGRSGEVKYVSPQGKSPVVTVTVDGKTERFVGAKEVQGLKAVESANAGADNAPSEPESVAAQTNQAPASPAANGERVTETTPAEKYKFGSTQANIPDESPAAKALSTARARISKEDLAGDGIDVGGNHVTVRYGIKGEDVEGVKKYLASLAPFEASLGPTETFPPSEHSDGAAVIHAPIVAPELHQINAELEKHGDFSEPNFDYKPHATVAYVKPEKASRYVGMSVTSGQKFPVSEIAITDRQGNQQVVKLEGKGETTAAAPALPRDLAGAKPRYGYQDKLFQLQFEDPRDLALYTVAQSTPNKAHGRYMEWLRGQFPKLSDEDIVRGGRSIREQIKPLAREGNPAAGPLVIPSRQGEPASKPASETQAPQAETIAAKGETKPVREFAAHEVEEAPAAKKSLAPEPTKPERERQTLGLPPEPGRVGEMNIRDLKVAPNKFQYKLSTDAEGVGTLLKETKVWNPDLAGMVSVWRDLSDGKTYVVNGHHRYELAKRLGVKTLVVRHIVAPTANAARAIGAEQNIADGRGTALDAAKFFRDSAITPADLKEKGISLGEATVAKGVALANLSEPIFNQVVQGDLTQGRAVVIGEATSDPAEQKAVLDLVERKERSGKKVSDDTLSELIRLVKGSGQTTETTADLFGTQQINRSLALEKAEISAHIKQQLAKDKKLFGFVSKGDRASELERGGNKIDVEKSKQLSTGAAQAEEVYNRLSARGGPIANILDESARQLADGDNAASVKSEAYSRIRAEVSKTLGGGEGSGTERHEGTPEPPEGVTHSPKPDDSVDLFSGAQPVFHEPLPLSARTAKDINFDLIETRAGIAPYLRVNDAAAKAISHSLGHAFLGVNIDKASVGRASAALRSAASSAEANKVDAKAIRQLRGLADALDEALDRDPNAGVNLVRQGPREIGTAHEELIHSAQRRAGKGNIGFGVPWQESLKMPAFAELGANSIVPQLRAAGLPAPASTIVAEGIVDIMRGEAALEGVSITDALEAAKVYFESALAHYGIEHLNELQAIQDYANDTERETNVTHHPEVLAIRRAGEAALARTIARGTGKALGRTGATVQSEAQLGTEERNRAPGAKDSGPPDDTGKADKGPSSTTKGPAYSTQPIGLTDEELEDWSKSRGFRVEPAGEQLDIFGGNQSVMRVFRAGRGGKEQKGLVYQSQLDQLSQPKPEPTEPFALTGGETREQQPTLFGAGDLGEIVGNPKAERGIQLPSQQRDRGTSLFKPEHRKEDRESLLTGESGTLTPSLSAAKAVYAKFINRIIDRNLDLGDKYKRVAEHDPAIATMLKEKDNAPRYFHAKAESNVEQVAKGLNESQVRLAAMMADSDSREFLEENHPEQFQEAQDDPAVMDAVKQFKQYQDELAAIRISLGWHVRRDLSTLEDENGDWSVVDRDGNEVETFGKSQKDAQEYAEEVGEVLDHLKRTYPEHKREPLMGRTDEGPSLGASYGGIKAPRPDKKQRIATAQYFYEHGAKDFSGYVKSFTQAYHAALNQKIYDSLTDEATKWKEGTAQPPQIEYRGQTYYSPDVAKSMKLAKPENRPKKILEYRAYDPAKDDKVMIRDFENGWSTTTTGRPGISALDRYLAPKDVVDALEHYDMTRGAEEGNSIRRFFQDQIVGLFGPNIHVLNIMRRLATTVGAGAWDPRVWPYYQRLFFSKELRERMAEGLADDAIDTLSKWGTYTNTKDIGSLHDYVLGNMDPRNWARWTIGKFSKGVLFDPKFLRGFGGLDQKARVLAYDFLHARAGMNEEEAAKNVEDGFGNYNKANWTERMKRWGRALLFPGWDFSSLKWFLRHPIKTALPALVVMGANLALNKAGKNRDSDKYDYSYLHYGDRKYRTGLITEPMALHLVEPILAAGRAALEGGDTRDIAGAAGQGMLRGGGGLAGDLRPDIGVATELLSNRQYLGGEKEIWRPEDANIPGTVLPTRKLEKMLAFSVVKALPAVSRFLDTSFESLDRATVAGSVIGVTNYKSGAEERLKANEAKAMGYSQTLSTLAEREPDAAERFVQEPAKAPYLMFNKDLAELGKDLKSIDTEMERVKIAEIPYADRKRALEDLRTSRSQLLQSADALDEELTTAKLQMKKAAGQ
jgi:2'-5' RNA ligase